MFGPVLFQGVALEQTCATAELRLFAALVVVDKSPMLGYYCPYIISLRGASTVVVEGDLRPRVWPARFRVDRH